MVNHTEKVVLETINDLIKQEEFKGFCICDQCLLDVASYALNRLPAKYIASTRGELQTKINEFENQVRVDMIAIITKAIKIVDNSPRH